MFPYAAVVRDPNTDFCRIIFLSDRSSFYRLKLECLSNHIDCELLFFNSDKGTFDSWKSGDVI